MIWIKMKKIRILLCSLLISFPAYAGEENATALSILEQSELDPAISEQLDLSFTENEWSFTEIRGVGKNLVSMASFYNVCANNGIIEKNLKAIRFASFTGMKYLLVAGMGTTEVERKWVEQGSNGLLIYDPETSEEAVQVEFSQETCKTSLMQITRC